MTIKWILHMVMLSVCSVEDWKEKEVSLWKIILYGFVIIGYGIWEIIVSDVSVKWWWMQAVTGAVPGICLLILAKVSNEAVGYADGVLTVLIGISMGFWQVVGILSTAFLGIFFTAVILFACCGRKKKTRIAFIPFLLLGMAGARIWMDF